MRRFVIPNPAAPCADQERNPESTVSRAQEIGQESAFAFVAATSFTLSAAEGPLATSHCKKGVTPCHLFSCVSYRKQTLGARKGCHIFRNPTRVGNRGERSRIIPPCGLVILSGVTGQTLPSRSCGTSGHAVEEPLFHSHNRLRSRREAQCGSAWLGAGGASMSGVMSSVRRTQ